MITREDLETIRKMKPIWFEQHRCDICGRNDNPVEITGDKKVCVICITYRAEDVYNYYFGKKEK